MYDKVNLPVNLRRIMDERNVSQRELADMLEVAPATISRYCIGSRYPDVEQVARIAEFLQVSVNELLGFATTTPDVITLEKCYFRCKQEDRDVLWALLRRYMDEDDKQVIFPSEDGDEA